MIKLLEKGIYRLVWAKDRQRILSLGDQGYLWSHAKGIGELLTFSKHSIRPGVWQGFLLLTGLPTKNKIRSRMVPTNEMISSKRAKKRISIK